MKFCIIPHSKTRFLLHGCLQTHATRPSSKAMHVWDDNRRTNCNQNWWVQPVWSTLVGWDNHGSEQGINNVWNRQSKSMFKFLCPAGNASLSRQRLRHDHELFRSCDLGVDRDQYFVSNPGSTLLCWRLQISKNHLLPATQPPYFFCHNATSDLWSTARTRTTDNAWNATDAVHIKSGTTNVWADPWLP